MIDFQKKTAKKKLKDISFITKKNWDDKMLEKINFEALKKMPSTRKQHSQNQLKLKKLLSKIPIRLVLHILRFVEMIIVGDITANENLDDFKKGSMKLLMKENFEHHLHPSKNFEMIVQFMYPLTGREIPIDEYAEIMMKKKEDVEKRRKEEMIQSKKYEKAIKKIKKDNGFADSIFFLSFCTQSSNRFCLCSCRRKQRRS